VTVRIGLTQPRGIDEGKFLQVTQHLHGRLGQGGQVEGAPVGLEIGEDGLVRQDGFAGARTPHDNVDRKLGQSAVEDGIQTGNARADTFELALFLPGNRH
jgi:hypothetical protein